MKKVNVGLYPRDGYWFQDKDGTILRATKSWRSVVAKVIAYRKRNKLPIGNPTAEVEAQACERNPTFCHDDADPATQSALKVARLKGRVLAWLSGLRNRRDTVLWGDAQNMAARANVCAGCPAHAAIAGGCGACKQAVKNMREDLLQGRHVDPRLSGCTVLGEDVAISCWIDEPLSDNPELPSCCWRRRHPPG